MGRADRKPDVDEAVKDPTQKFDTPMDVVDDSRLTKDEKRQILESWAQDAQLMSNAEAENMGGPGRPRLQEVKLALIELDKRP
jgi:hypothetical protein